MPIDDQKYLKSLTFIAPIKNNEKEENSIEKKKRNKIKIVAEVVEGRKSSEKKSPCIYHWYLKTTSVLSIRI